MALVLSSPNAEAFWSVGSKVVPKTASKIGVIYKNPKAVSEQDIARLSKLSTEVKGTKKVGKELGKLNLSNSLLEDTYLRVAIHKGIITREKAIEMYSYLGGTPGFRATVRKITGNSAAVTKGHLNELDIALAAKKSGFKVNEIGYKFKDGLKNSLTDMDVIISKGNKTFVIEAKEYSSTSRIPLDKFRADLDSLVAYKKSQKDNVTPIFSITNKNINERYNRTLQREAKKRGVELIYGNPHEQIHKINMLSKTL